MAELTKSNLWNIYRFVLTVKTNGEMSLPILPELSNSEVEVILIPQKAALQPNLKKASHFVAKWAGLLKGSPNLEETKDWKDERLKEKYG